MKKEVFILVIEENILLLQNTANLSFQCGIAVLVLFTNHKQTIAKFRCLSLGLQFPKAFVNAIVKVFVKAFVKVFVKAFVKVFVNAFAKAFVNTFALVFITAFEGQPNLQLPIANTRYFNLQLFNYKVKCLTDLLSIGH